MNRTQVIGIVGVDPHVGYTPNGLAVCKVRVASHEYFKKSDGSGKPNIHTEWHTAVFFGGAAEIVGKHARKGRSIYFAGPLRKRQFQDAEGKERLSVEVLVREWEFTSRRMASTDDQPALNDEVALEPVDLNGLPGSQGIPF